MCWHPHWTMADASWLFMTKLQIACAKPAAESEVKTLDKKSRECFTLAAQLEGG